ncbi:MAG: hypothetical protein H8K04_01930 [Nitrospira sp.]
MTADQAADNRRILVIDDNVNIHEDFRRMLAHPKDSDLTKRWNLARAVTLQIEILALSVTQRTAELQKANERLHDHAAGQAVEHVTSQSQGDVTDAFRHKEEFLAIMSHEISVPMNELMSKVALLLDSPLNPEQREQMATIQKCARDVRTLLGDLHEFMAGRRPETQVEHRQ